MDYRAITPIDSAIKADRQGAKRHYGVHPYFTRRPQNVVREHILHFTKPGDVILDPFGGSGVTAIEALYANRTGIQNDINPLANFIADGIADLRFVNLECLGKAFDHVLGEYDRILQGNTEALLNRIEAFLPIDVKLPKTSDVRTYRELFTERQLRELALLRMSIQEIADEHSRRALMLAWSATLSKINRTFISTTGRAASRGGSSIFSIYRYKVASNNVDLDTRAIFRERFANIVAATKEIDRLIRFQRQQDGDFTGEYQSYSLDVLSLPEVLANKVDYIFTDPPYGGHIAYLDLSTLWNVWLGNEPTEDTRSREIIVGGMAGITETEYIDRLGKSIKACCSMLKRNRWMSVVFQHSQPKYFAAILDAAAEAGAELRSAVTQVGDTIWSMHKKKNGEGVLGGEFILTFYNSSQIQKSFPKKQFDVSDWLRNAISSNGEKVYAEELLNGLILEAWKRGSLDSLSISKEELNSILKDQGLHYEPSMHCWQRVGSAQHILF